MWETTFMQISDVVPGGAAFSGTPELEQLFLDGNEVSHTVENARSPFAGLPRLRVLSLRRNRIKSVWSGALAGLVGLEELRMEGNVISTLEKGAFDGCPMLR